MSRTRHNLPDNLTPVDDICYPLFVPDDPQWKQHLIRALRTLTFDRHWERDENDGQDAIAVRQRWNTSTYLPFIDALQEGETCADDTGEIGSCFRVDTSHEIFQYYPNDPFNPDDDLGTSIGLQWLRIANVTDTDIDWLQPLIDFGLGLTGYFPNDVVLVPKIFNPHGLKRLEDFVSSFTEGLFPFPSITIELSGTGQLELEFLNVPLGGSVFVFWDIEPTIQQVVDLVAGGEAITNSILLELNRDLPTELVVTQVQEIEFTEAGDHYVTMWFIPRIDDSVPFLFPFGGFREIEVCGELEIIGSQSGTAYTKQTYGEETASRKGAITAMTVQDICDGVWCAMLKGAQALLLSMDDNLRGGIEIVEQEDGTFRVQLDSTTRQAIDTAPKVLPEANIFGGAFAAQSGLDTAMQLIVDGHTNSVPEADVVQFLQFSWNLNNSEVASCVSAVYADLTASQSVFQDFSDFADYAFCNGVTLNSLSDYMRANAALGEYTTAIEFIQMWTPEQFAIWRDRGLEQPKEGYQNTECYKIPDQFHIIHPEDIFDGTANSTFLTGTIFFDSPARASIWSYLLYATGRFEHSNGDWFELYWSHQGGSFQNNIVRLVESTTAFVPEEYPLRTQSPMYAEFHMSVNHEPRQIRISKPAWNAVDVTGSITVQLVDNGKV